MAETTNTVLDETADKTTNTVSDETAVKTTNTVSDETADKTTNTVSDETAVKTTNTVPAKTADKISYEQPRYNFDEMSEVDLAYKLLTEAGKDNPAYFKTLIRTIIKLKNKAVQNEAAAISEIYTMINMDSRFQHMGDGRWGLTDWVPPETKRSSRSRSTTSKTTS